MARGTVERILFVSVVRLYRLNRLLNKRLGSETVYTSVYIYVYVYVYIYVYIYSYILVYTVSEPNLIFNKAGTM